jgi:hypothetical protein
MNESFTSIAKVFPLLEGFMLDETVDNIHINPNGMVFIKTERRSTTGSSSGITYSARGTFSISSAHCLDLSGMRISMRPIPF